MPRRFDLIVFDWDGTLMDSAGCIADSLQAACQDLGLQVPSDRDARFVIGLGLNEALGHILPAIAPTVYPKVVERYRHHFLQREGATTLFPGVPELLQGLRTAGHALAVATGESRRGLDRALAVTGLAASFDATRCADESHSKPHPGMLHSLLDEFAISAERALMIGDTSHDMLMAVAAGVSRVAVGHGAHDERDLVQHEPLAFVRNCDALRRWLAEHA